MSSTTTRICPATRSGGDGGGRARFREDRISGEVLEVSGCPPGPPDPVSEPSTATAYGLCRALLLRFANLPISHVRAAVCELAKRSASWDAPLTARRAARYFASHVQPKSSSPTAAKSPSAQFVPPTNWVRDRCGVPVRRPQLGAPPEGRTRRTRSVRSVIPVRAYLGRRDHRGGRACGADAIYPGYGFLSENRTWPRRAKRTASVRGRQPRYSS